MCNIIDVISELESKYETIMIKKLNAQCHSFISEPYRSTMGNAEIEDMELKCNHLLFDILRNKTILNMTVGESWPPIFSDSECIVCCDNHVLKVVMSPCRHKICLNCITTLMNRNKRIPCPMCRQNVSGYEYFNTNTMSYDFFKLYL